MSHHDNLNPIATFTVGAEGGFSATNRLLGCNSSGRLSIIDARFNVYGFQGVAAGDRAIGGKVLLPFGLGADRKDLLGAEG